MHVRNFHPDESLALRCLQGRFFMKYPGYIEVFERVIFTRDDRLPIGGIASGVLPDSTPVIALSTDFLELPMKAQLSGIQQQLDFIATMKGWEDDIQRGRDHWKARPEAQGVPGPKPRDNA